MSKGIRRADDKRDNLTGDERMCIINSFVNMSI